MSDKPAIDESARLKPVTQRQESRLSMVIKFALLTVILVAVNYLSCVRFERNDISKNGRFTLSERSAKFIQSPDIEERENPIKITVAFRRSASGYDRIRDLIEEYGDRSDGIEVDFLDPLRNPNEARKLQNRYQLSFDQNQIIVDARPDPSLDPQAGRKKKITPDKKELTDLAQIRFLTEEDLIVYENDENGTPKAVSLRVEDAVTAAIVSAVEGKPRRVYIIADKSNLGATTGEDAPYWRLFNALRLQNVLLVPLRLGDIQDIPADAEAIVFIGPQYDLEKDEVAILERYWQRPKSGILTILDPAAEPTSLHSFLRANGVSPRKDRIIRIINDRPIYDVTAVFSSGINFTRDFWSNSTIFEGQTRSLDVREGDSRLAARQVHPVPLLEATRGYYGETRYIKAKPSFDKNEDNYGKLYLAAAVERGNTNDVELSSLTSRMVVIGNTEFLMPTKLRSEQLDFVTSSVNWMLDREELAGIGARENLLFKVSVDEPTSSAIGALALGVLPALALIIALVVWNVRRR